MRAAIPAILLLMAAVLGACGGSSGASGPGGEDVTPSPPAGTVQPIPTAAGPAAVTTQAPAPTRVIAPGAARDPDGAEDDPALVAGAVAHLAARLGVDASAIRAGRPEPVNWPDTSLGCAQPGMMYAQVITPGYRVVLQAGGATYTYHLAANGQFVLCLNAP